MRDAPVSSVSRIGAPLDLAAEAFESVGGPDLAPVGVGVGEGEDVLGGVGVPSREAPASSGEP